MAKEYLAKNDELSTWFLEEFEECKAEERVDAGGLIVHFVSLKEVKELYVSQPIYTSMRKEDQRKFNTKKLISAVCKFLRHRPLWALVRSFVRARAVVVYWLGLTEHLMAPGGAAEARDRMDYEMDQGRLAFDGER